MASLQEEIQKKAREYLPEITDIRRHLHQNPELSFQEHKTAAFVEEQLTRFGIPYKTGIAGTGIVGLIEGNDPGAGIVALRADMDALPIPEKNEALYKSKNDGVMHACGHDAHTASLIGASKILNELKSEFSGTIKLVFQPGEEQFPGGASLMIEEGVLEQPRVEYMLGQHVYPQLDAGTVGFRGGQYMASADEVYMKVHGQGGHGAYPHENIDPVLITAHLITGLQQVVSRFADPLSPVVLSFGKVIANGATNIIPPEVKIDGTFRAFDEELRFRCHEQIRKIAHSIVEGMGGRLELDIVVGYPSLFNDYKLTEKSMAFARQYLGEKNVVDLEMRMGSEDFAYFSQKTKSCFYRLGTGNPSRGITSGLHSPTFDIDESALKTGMGLMAWLACNSISS